MKGAVVVLGILLVGVVAVAASRGGWRTVTEGLRLGGREALTLLPLLAVILVLTGFVQVLLPPEVVGSWLSDDAGWRGIGVAWLAGALTPGGGAIGMPLAATLVRSGAGVGVVVTYLTSLSLLSFVRVPMEVTIYGARLTALRVLATFALPPVAGAIAQTVGRLLIARR